MFLDFLNKVTITELDCSDHSSFYLFISQNNSNRYKILMVRKLNNQNIISKYLIYTEIRKVLLDDVYLDGYGCAKHMLQLLCYGKPPSDL